MNWKYLIIAVAEVAKRKVNLQFEVVAESASQAEEIAKTIMVLYFPIDVLEIRRL